MTENLPATALAPRTLEEAMQFADTISQSKMLPKDYQGNSPNVLVAVQMGQEIGLPPLQAIQSIAVINGRPSIYGDAALAVVMARPDCDRLDEKVEGDGDNMVATCTVVRGTKRTVTQSFSVEDAKRAGLWGKQGPWSNYPKRMLQMRARGFALRDAFPDALRGLSFVEEVQDIPPERDVTPPREDDAPKPTRLADKLEPDEPVEDAQVVEDDAAPDDASLSQEPTPARRSIKRSAK